MKSLACGSPLRRFLTMVVSSGLALLAGSTIAQAAHSDTAKQSAGYPAAQVKIPVEDARTKFITGELSEPRGVGPFPAVILLHGCGGIGPINKGAFRRVNAEYLPKGIATILVDSFAPRGVASVCSGPSASESIRYRVKDAYAATSWLAARSEIDSKHIFLQGYSHGAMTAIAAIDARNRLSVTHKRRFAGVIAFYPYCYSLGIKFSVPTLILIGKSDDWTPAAFCEAILDKTNVKITVYPNATHGFVYPGDHTVLGHHLVYDEAATNDALRRALALIETLSKQAR